MKRSINYFCSLCLILISISFFAQNETKKWYFGWAAGLDFTANPPGVLTTTNVNMNSGSASVADDFGNLLFYTNGRYVYTKTHALMTNGSGLAGTAFNGVLIIKKPASANLYYIFTLNLTNFTQTFASDGLYYSVVDMSQAGGQGAVIQKNVQLYSGIPTMKLTGTKHCNGSDYWVVMKEPSDTNTSNILNGIYKFRAFQLSSAGVNTLASVSTFTYILPMQYLQAPNSGQMKISPQGKKLACANYNFQTNYNSNMGSFELYDFDNSTGQVSNFVPLYTSPPAGPKNASGYGVEFSPDASKLYGTLSNNIYHPGGSIIEWDLCSGTNSLVSSTQTVVANPTFTPYNGYMNLQLAANGKIYAARFWPNNTAPALSVINFPNQYGAATGFSLVAQLLNPAFNNSHCLPNFMSCQFFMAAAIPAFSYTPSIGGAGCQSIQFQSPLQIGASIGNCPANTYTLQNLQWDFGDPGSGSANTSVLPNPAHTYFSVGTYSVKLLLDFGCGGGSQLLTQTISINNPNFGNLNFTPGLACNSVNTGTATFTNQQSSGLLYVWTNGTSTYTTPFVSNLSAGSWTSVVTNTLTSCQSNTVFTIVQPPALTVSISSPTICQNNTIAVNAGGGTGPLNYLWSNGNTSPNGVGNLLGLNTVTVSDANACKLISNFTVYANPSIVTSGTTICSGNSFTLSASGASNYTWSAGPIVSPFVSTSYSVVGEANGCFRDTAVWVMVNPSPTVTTNSPFIVICRGHTTTLTASGASTYTWSNNMFVPSFVYSNSTTGYFWLYITGANANTCTHTASMLIKVDECFTDLKETIFTDAAKIYPNPSSGEIIIEVESANIYLINAVGEIVFEGKVEVQTKLLVETPGIYFLRFETEKGISNHKVIVTK